MKHLDELNADAAVWGPCPNYDDIEHFEYGRLLWERPAMRARLLAHWTDARHPYRERFAARRADVEALLCSTESAPMLDKALRERDLGLRCLIREIPPVFGSFFADSKEGS